MSAHFSYQHMPAGGVGVLDDQFRPYSSGGIGAAVPAHGEQGVSPGHIDSRPLLFPPEIHVGSVPTDLPLIDASATIYLPVLQRVRAIDIVKMRLGLVHDTEIMMVMSPAEYPFRLGAAMTLSEMMLGVGQMFAAKLGIEQTFTENFTQTFDR